MVKRGELNGNWKGGIASIRKDDDFADLTPNIKQRLRKRLLDGCRRNLITGCWNWKKGVFRSNGRSRIGLGTGVAARICYVLFKGKTDGMYVLHSCDNVLCVNPSHFAFRDSC